MGTPLPLLQYQPPCCESLYTTSSPAPISTVISRHQNGGKPMRDLTLKRIRTATNPFRFNQPKVFCSSNNIASATKLNKVTTMADEANNKNNNNSQSAGIEPSIGKDKEGQMKGLEKSKQQGCNNNIPPPPEKPLPGDCCGSGCVRCVWDVYYEELEDYNKLYKTSPPDSNSNKPSSK